jgi:hypothetical protein
MVKVTTNYFLVSHDDKIAGTTKYTDLICVDQRYT